MLRKNVTQDPVHHVVVAHVQDFTVLTTRMRFIS